MDYDRLRIPLEKGLSDELFQMFRGDIISGILKEAVVEESGGHVRAMLEGHAFRLTPRMAPGLHDLAAGVRKKLGLADQVEFYVVSNADINCAAYPAQEDGKEHVVMIHSGLLERFDDEELCFVLGHELGHLISRNSELSRIMEFVFPAQSNIPLLLQNKVALWNKLAELSADRYGFLACRNLDKCVSAFFKMASGLDTARFAFSASAYHEEVDAVLEFFRSHPEGGGSTHPVNPIRIKALQFFAGSALFKSVSETGEAVEDETLESQVGGLLDVMISQGFSELDRHRAFFMASGGLIMAGADGELSEDEAERILLTLASTTHFPQAFLGHVHNSGKVEKIFTGSASAILSVNPGERSAMFSYLIDVVLADRRLNDKEIDLLFDLGDKVFSFSRKEVAQALAARIQHSFIPRFSD
ncbi:MAG: hypothetical protein FJ109_15920 [Deltaproteobacteria bacterium]|nr:hypothetical protein [Deltaproteobacteria bacterium]